MATPIVNTLPETAYPFAAVGSGSRVIAGFNADFGTPTGQSQPDRWYYSLTDLLQGHSSNSVPTSALRQKTSNVVGSWLASTEGMLLESDATPQGTYARALDELKANLGVTLTYIAKCLTLQRSAIYRWYEGRQPHAANRSRLETIREFAAAWRAARLPSLRNYWDIPVPGIGTTLGELLSADTLDVNRLRAAIDSLIVGTREGARNGPRLGFPGRQRNRDRDRTRLSVLIPPTSHESDDNEA